MTLFDRLSRRLSRLLSESHPMRISTVRDVADILIIFFIIVVAIAAAISIGGGVYVALHFIIKYW